MSFATAPSPADERAAAERAVERARGGADGWAARTPAQRADVLLRAAGLVSAAAAELAVAITAAVAKPITEARGEAARTAGVLRHAAGLATRPSGRSWAADDPATMVVATRAPLGTVALVTPFNFPTAIPGWKLGPALAAGNSVVWKPSEAAIEPARILHRLLVEAGVPADALQLVLGGPAAGEVVTGPGVDGVSFTGSAAVGRTVAARCATAGIPVQLELGGKNTSIVLADADLPAAAHDIAMAAFGFAGQKCTATSRLLVAKDVADRFADLLAAEVDQLPVGDPADESTVCGPVVSAAKAAQLREQLAGLDVAAAADVAETGAMVAPRVVRDVPADHPAWTTELFGPVLAMRPVADHREAFALVNAAADGLAAGVYTASSAVVQETVRTLRAGVIAVNRPTTGLDAHVPFGGTGRTSAGPREQGPDAMDFYTEERTVYWRESPR